MKKISIAILTLLVVLSACKKVPEVNLKYVDVERDLITVGTTTATVQCDYEYIATLKKAYLYYGEGQDEVDMNAAEMRVVQNTLYVDLAGLRENTTYSYYYEFHNGFNSMRTAVKTFKTEASPAGVTLPTVVTASVTEITTNSAKGGGEVTNDGGAEVTERGICWSTNANPTLSDSHVAAGTGTGAFTAMMSDLQASTTYHVRAYATNSAGTAYGLDKEFTTLSGGGSGAPEGAINGLFTINDNGDQVYFSRGNLQYQASTNTWRFAEHQWDYVGTQTPETGEPGGTVSGSDNYCISQTYSGWIDLFGWGTSGYHYSEDPYNVNYQPWSSSVNPVSNYNRYGYGPSANMDSPNLTGVSANYDWGIFNSISNGGNAVGQWRTLTDDEWVYLINDRITTSGARYAHAQVNGVNGVILFPDEWREEIYDISNYNVEIFSDFSDNVISASHWGILESNGAAFLPTAGSRFGTAVKNVDSQGYYWSVTDFDNLNAVCIWLTNTNFSRSAGGRCCGSSVRLVQDAH